MNNIQSKTVRNILESAKYHREKSSRGGRLSGGGWGGSVGGCLAI